jgi:hypothetical protein
MPSLNFEIEEGEFRRFYDEKAQPLEDAKNSYIALITALCGNTWPLASRSKEL